MPSRKYNEFLDNNVSEEEDGNGYESEEREKKGGKGIVSSTRRSKRQKFNHFSSDDEDEESGSASDLEESNLTASKISTEIPTVLQQHSVESSSLKTIHPTSSASTKAQNLLSKKSLEASQARAQKAGVVYLSRIPPFMRPSTVKHLLSPFGTINRLFLTPEPTTAHHARVRNGGNKKRSFVDGWVEFSRKKHAKICVDAINGQTMGGRGWYKDDVWNAKYLKGFGWEDLMASVRAEEREREERVRVGVRRDKREREEFLRGVERAKVEEGKRRKREEKAKRKEALLGSRKEGGGGEGKSVGPKGFERRFRQNEVKTKTKAFDEQPDEVKRVLSKIF